MSSIAEARQFKAHLEGLDASGVFIPGLAAGGVWSILEKLKVVSYGELISTFPYVELEDFDHALFTNQTPGADYSFQERYLATAALDDERFLVTTSNRFGRSLDLEGRRRFGHTDHAWS